MDNSFTSVFFYKAFRILAILLIVGVFLPIIAASYKGSYLLFSNFQLLVSEGTDFLVRIGAVFPLLTGAVILYLTSLKKLRKVFIAITVFILSLLQFLFFKSDFLDIIDSGIIGGAMFQSSSLFFLGVTLILIAGLIIWSGNLSIIPKIIGAAGGVFFILYLVMPVQTGGTFFGVHQMPIGSFFDMIGMADSPAGSGNIMGISLVLNSGLLAAASVLCFLVFKPRYNNKSTGKKISVYWAWSQIALLAGLLYSLITTLFDFSRFIMMFLLTAKVLLLLYGIILLLVLSTVYIFLLLVPIEVEEDSM